MARAKKSDTSDKGSRELSEEVGGWLDEIASARKREQKYRDEGKEIRKIYSGENSESTPFNILSSNTEIIAPALYSQVPRPVVERRFKDKNPLGQAAAEAGKRGLEFLLDTSIDGYDTFHDAMRSSVLDAILPGRGVTGIKYEPKLEGDVKVAELVCAEIINWDKVYFGYAKKWSRMPWMAFELELDEKECERLFGKEKAEAIEYTTGDDEDDKKASKDQGTRKTAMVYQIWDKNGGRKIRYISRHYPEGYLKVEDDPLGLTGFYKIPRPLQFIEKTSDMTPTAMYTLYKNQAEELNRLTIRINKLVSAMKARGAYDSALGDDIERIFDGDDNQLVPTDKGASFAAERGIGNAIWFVPLEVLQQTLQQLYLAREQCKQVIYEIMGISDIVRGASKASETLGAQQLKSQWGTMRLKNKQSEVQRYSRDMLRMMLELAASKFSQDTWAKMTGLPFLTDEQFAQAQMMAQALQQQAMMPGPQQQQMQLQLQQVQQQLQQSKWADVLGILQDDLQRAYKIDIETNSTIEPEAAEDQKQISELMNAIGQFVNGIGPMIEKGVMPFEMAKAMLLAITRRFRFGNEVEGMLDGMQPPKPEDNGEKEKAAKALQQAAADKQASQQAMADSEAKLRDAQSKLTAAQEQLKLVQRETALALEQKQLEYDRKIFDIEKKVAQETLQRNIKVETQSLDAKKKEAGFETQKADAAKNVSKAVDSKMSEGIAKLQEIVSQLASSTPAGSMAEVKKLAEIVSLQAQEINGLARAVSAPKRKKAIRDKEGRIVETVEESLQ